MREGSFPRRIIPDFGPVGIYTKRKEHGHRVCSDNLFRSLWESLGLAGGKSLSMGAKSYVHIHFSIATVFPSHRRFLFPICRSSTPFNCALTNLKGKISVLSPPSTLSRMTMTCSSSSLSQFSSSTQTGTRPQPTSLEHEKLWKEYVEKATLFDERMIENWNKIVDVTLVFVGVSYQSHNISC